LEIIEDTLKILDGVLERVGVSWKGACMSCE